MSTLEAVRAELALDSALVALVSTRMYPQVLPPDMTTMPALTITVVSEVPVNSLSSSPGLQNARVQIDCFGKTYASARAVHAAVFAVLTALSRHNLSAYADGAVDTYDNETQRHWVSADYIVSL